MTIGYIYIIGHPIFKKDDFKMGFTDGTKKDLEARYNTYYVDNVIVHGMYIVADKRLGEKLLFQRLKKYRIKSNKEFFHCDLNILKQECENVANIINNDEVLNEDDIFDDHDDITKLNIKYRNIIHESKKKELQIKIKRADEKNKLHDKNKKIVENFINKYCVIDVNNTTRSSILYAFYKSTVTDSEILDVKFFSPIMEELGYTKIKTVNGYLFKGIDLKEKDNKAELDKNNLEKIMMNEIDKFIDDECEKGPDKTVSSSELYSLYLKNGAKMSQKSFTQMMNNMGYTTKKTNRGNIFIGLDIIDKNNDLD
jgi:hypothetical protein